MTNVVRLMLSGDCFFNFSKFFQKIEKNYRTIMLKNKKKTGNIYGTTLVFDENNYFTLTQKIIFLVCLNY